MKTIEASEVGATGVTALVEPAGAGAGVEAEAEAEAAAELETAVGTVGTGAIAQTVWGKATGSEVQLGRVVGSVPFHQVIGIS